MNVFNKKNLYAFLSATLVCINYGCSNSQVLPTGSDILLTQAPYFSPVDSIKSLYIHNPMKNYYSKVSIKLIKCPEGISCLNTSSLSKNITSRVIANYNFTPTSPLQGALFTNTIDKAYECGSLPNSCGLAAYVCIYKTKEALEAAQECSPGPSGVDFNQFVKTAEKKCKYSQGKDMRFDVGCLALENALHNQG